MVGKASGVWSASLWNRTIEPFSTREVTRWQMLSVVAFSFQSRLSPYATVGSAYNLTVFTFRLQAFGGEFFHGSLSIVGVKS